MGVRERKGPGIALHAAATWTLRFGGIPPAGTTNKIHGLTYTTLIVDVRVSLATLWWNIHNVSIVIRSCRLIAFSLLKRRHPAVNVWPFLWISYLDGLPVDCRCHHPFKVSDELQVNEAWRISCQEPHALLVTLLPRTTQLIVDLIKALVEAFHRRLCPLPVLVPHRILEQEQRPHPIHFPFEIEQLLCPLNVLLRCHHGSKFAEGVVYELHDVHTVGVEVAIELDGGKLSI
mmetsp:Transcript_19163/g.34238  ORF Transcript_19163/g.34238 Transcript_19163/m.34238 type:complete len:232 (-) Transcript_19163:161-856(-)